MTDSTDCIFCRIATGDLHDKTSFEFEDDLVVAFPDLHPIAPVHLLIVPKQHVADLNGVTTKDEPFYGRIVHVASQLAAKKGIAAGWQLFVRVGKGGGQEVSHVHFHLVAGKHA